MRPSALVLSATLVATSLVAYLVLGKQARNDPTSIWGDVRVGCFVVNVISTITLAVLLGLYRDELKRASTIRPVLIGVCLMGGFFLIDLAVGLMRFLFP